MQFPGQQITLDTRALEYARQLENRTDLRGPLTYLAQHGITSREVMARYMLGCVMSPVPGDERFRGSLCIPYLSRRGEVVSIKYRCVRAHNCKEVSGHAKYDKYQGDRSTLYNKAAFFLADNIIGIAEGEIDAIVATEVLDIPTVGVPGATQWGSNSDAWNLAFKDYDHILVFADGDEAGLKFARDVAGELGHRCRIVKCDEQEDVSSMVTAGKTEDLKKRAGLYDGGTGAPPPPSEGAFD